MNLRNLQRTFLIGCIALLTGLGSTLLAQTERDRPKAPDLLPERTVAYVQFDNVKQLAIDFWDSNFGRMLQDEEIAPLIEELYGEAKEAYKTIEGDVGLSLDTFLSLPQGEVCFAVVAPRRQTPVFVLMLDVSQEDSAADDIITRIRELASDDGATFDTVDEQGITVEVIHGDDDVDVFYVVHQGTFLAATDQKVFGNMLTRWVGTPPEGDRSLATNRRFVTIMNKCRGTDDLPMAMSFFVDPIALARSITADNIGARAAFAVLPVLGLDGLNGLGGASLFNEQGYESIFHGHVLLANPRAGIFEAIALKPGYYKPERWVPADTAAYITSNWDFAKFMIELTKMVDFFGGEGTLETQIQENINDELGIDLQADVIDNLEGRVTYIAWINDPPRINGQSNAIAATVQDPEKARDFIKALLERVDEDGDNVVEESYGGVDYWKSAEDLNTAQQRRQREFRNRRAGREPDDDGDEPFEEEFRVEMRPMELCFGFVGDTFVFTESRQCFEHLIDTYNGDAPGLADDETFKETMKDLKALLGTSMPSLTSYGRPDLSLRMWYELVDEQNTRDLLARGAEENEFFKGLQRAIEDHPLPPFEKIAHYFTPQGSFVVNDESGFHFMVFQKRAEEKDD